MILFQSIYTILKWEKKTKVYLRLNQNQLLKKSLKINKLNRKRNFYALHVDKK